MCMRIMKYQYSTRYHWYWFPNYLVLYRNENYWYHPPLDRARIDTFVIDTHYCIGSQWNYVPRTSLNGSHAFVSDTHYCMGSQWNYVPRTSLNQWQGSHAFVIDTHYCIGSQWNYVPRTSLNQWQVSLTSISCFCYGYSLLYRKPVKLCTQQS